MRRTSRSRWQAALACALAVALAGPAGAASPAPSPSNRDTAPPTPLLLGQVVGPGSYFYRGMGLDMTFQVPDGWLGASLGPDAGFMALPAGQAAVVTVTVFEGAAYADSCNPESKGPIEHTAASFLDLIGSNPYLEVGEVTESTIAGTPAREVQVSVPSPGEEACADEQPGLRLWAPSETVDFLLQDGEQARVIALETAGRVVVIVAEAFPGVDYETFLEGAALVIDSITIKPAPVELPPNIA